MAEETTRVPPTSPLIKPRRSVESPRSSTTSGKGVPIYLRTSTGSCHEFCKHGKPEGHVSEVKETRPWRKPVTGANPKSLHTKETEVPGLSKKTMVPKPKPSPDPIICSISRETTNVDVSSEQASSDARKSEEIKPEESSVAPEIIVASADMVKLEVTTPENVKVTVGPSLDAKEPKLPKKPTTPSKVKPSVGSRSQISLGASNLERNSLDGKKTVDGKRIAEVKDSLDRRKSFEGSKNVEGRKSLRKKKVLDESEISDQETVQKVDDYFCHPDKSSEGNKTADGIENIGGTNSSTEKKDFEGITSSGLETKIKNGNLCNAKSDDGSESLKKHLASPRPKISQVKPQASLPTVKPPSPHLLSGARTSTSDDDPVAKKLSTSKVPTKKVGAHAMSSISPGPSENGVESSDTKKVRILRVVSSVRRQIKTTKVEVKDPNDQDVQGDTSDAIKVDPAKKSSVLPQKKFLKRKSLLPPAPPATKSTVRARVSYLPPRIKKPIRESEQTDSAKDNSISVLRKGMAVDMKSGNNGPPKLRVRRTTTLLGDTAQTKGRSLKKRDGFDSEVVSKTSSSDRLLLRRPSVRGKKNVQVLFNKVIEETANRLVRTRKSKVLALVGAFETVISIQKKKSTTGANPKPKVKRISSSSKPSS